MHIGDLGFDRLPPAALRLGGLGRGGRCAWAETGHASDSQGEERGQQLVHFARTIRMKVRSRSTFDYTGAAPCAHPSPHPMKFQGSQNYVATQDLMLAVNAAITLKRPLLVKGEPGTGKTMLAEEVARRWACRCCSGTSSRTTKAQQGLYEYDAVSRLRDSQLRRRARQGHPQLHRQGRAVAGLHGRAAGGAADRRDRQGRHRVPERPAARARPHGVLRLRDARAGPRRSTGRWCSSPPTTRRNCRTPSCAAASSTTSSSPTPTR